jgi:hypothetical protein
VAAIAALIVEVENLSRTTNPKNHFVAIAADSTEFDSARFDENQAIGGLSFQEQVFFRGIRRRVGDGENLATLTG